jgi:hypothetical protein
MGDPEQIDLDVEISSKDVPDMVKEIDRLTRHGLSKMEARIDSFEQRIETLEKEADERRYEYRRDVISVGVVCLIATIILSMKINK